MYIPAKQDKATLKQWHKSSMRESHQNYWASHACEAQYISYSLFVCMMNLKYSYFIVLHWQQTVRTEEWQTFCLQFHVLFSASLNGKQN